MKNWISKQSPKVQLLFIFLFNVLLWICLDLILSWFGIFDQLPIKALLLKGVIMGVVWTIVFNWKFVKMAFSKTSQ